MKDTAKQMVTEELNIFSADDSDIRNIPSISIFFLIKLLAN